MSRTADIPETRFAPSRGGRIAYQVSGAGEQTVVAIPPLAQNIELAWERPEIRRMLERFESFCRYVAFDKRGTGCSDRRSQPADIDERIDDLRAVMDHAGIDRAHLFGSSEGGPMTLLFAATYPERVDGLILFGSGASVHPPDMTEADLQLRRDGYATPLANWGTPASNIAAHMASSIAEQDPSFVPWHQRYERFAASPESLRDLLELALHMDVRDVLPGISAPTLVIHRTDDPSVSIERAREVVAGLPDARLFEQPGRDHYAYAGDVDAWQDEFERFVTGEVRERPPVRTRPAVHITSLGRFAVEVDGVEVPSAAWGSRRSRQLCKRLVAARGWPVTRDELFDLLWPDETERRRLGSRLSVQLSTVRRVLHGGIVADRQSIRLDLDEVTTDLEALYRAPHDDAIVAAWPGEFLPDDRYEAWTDGVRDELRARFVLAARRRAKQAGREGDVDRAVALCHRLLEVDRHDEQAHALLVAAWLRSGATGEAQRAHTAWVAAMEELDLPAPSFDSLREV